MSEAIKRQAHRGSPTVTWAMLHGGLSPTVFLDLASMLTSGTKPCTFEATTTFHLHDGAHCTVFLARASPVEL